MLHSSKSVYQDLMYILPRKEQAFENFAYLKENILAGHAVTLRTPDGRPVAILSYKPLGHIADVCALVSPLVSLYKKSFVNACDDELTRIREKFKRVQVMVHEDFIVGKRFIRYLGFSYEGTLRYLTNDGKNYSIFARVKNGR